MGVDGRIVLVVILMKDELAIKVFGLGMWLP